MPRRPIRFDQRWHSLESDRRAEAIRILSSGGVLIDEVERRIDALEAGLAGRAAVRAVVAQGTNKMHEKLGVPMPRGRPKGRGARIPASVDMIAGTYRLLTGKKISKSRTSDFYELLSLLLWEVDPYDLIVDLRMREERDRTSYRKACEFEKELRAILLAEAKEKTRGI